MSSRRNLPSVLGNDAGASLLEFALVLPIIALVVIAIVDFGRGLAINMALESAARSGAEYSALFPQDAAGLQNAILQALGPGVTADSIGTRVQCRCAGVDVASCDVSCNGSGAEMFMQVSISSNYRPILPYPGIPDNFSLVGSAEFRNR